MTAPADDFSIFADTEHMFFGLSEPYAVIREELESVFVAQVESSRLHTIVAEGEPKFLTMGYRLEDDHDKVVVTHYGACFQATVDVESDGHRESALRCTMTLCVGKLDQPGEEHMQTWLHVHDDADAAFVEEAFEQRFMEFREASDELSDEAPDET